MTLQKHKKIVAIVVAAAFLWIGIAWASDTTPSFQEKEAPPVIQHQRHFPWLWIAAGAVATGVLVYFLAKKTPEFKLTVELDASASGSPGTGVTAYKKGQSASYDFAARPGFDELTVLLDGVKVKSRGTFKMVRDHALKVSARPITYSLTVDMAAGVTGTPPAGATTRAWHDSIPYAYALADGFQNLKVFLDGAAVPASGSILMDRDHTLAVTAEKISEPPFSIYGLWRVDLTPVSGQPTAPRSAFVRIVQYSIYWDGSEYRTFWYDSPEELAANHGSVGHGVRSNGQYSFDSGSQYRICCFNGTPSGENTMSGKYEYWHIGESSGDTAIWGSGTWSAYRQ
jgi:hypothetical protein